MWANPSSPHGEGRRARAALEDARARIKASLGWQGELIFTGGASEALAIGLSQARIGGGRAARRIVSAAEHDAVTRAAPDAQVLPVTDGVPDHEELERLLSPGPPAIVAVQQVNSETGTILLPNDGADLGRRVRNRGGLLLADCSQSAGKLALPDADMAVVSAHKLGGPVGIGALLVRDFGMLEAVGGHERGYRAGTENLPAALGFAAALEAGECASWATSDQQRREFAQRLSQSGKVVRPGAQVSYILALTHPAMSAQAQLIRLDAMGFAVSAGSACSSGSLKPSRVLATFGLGEDEARRTIRVSLGWSTTPAELDAFVSAWASLAPVEAA